MIELRESEIDALIRMGLLRAEARNNLPKVREAFYDHLDRSLGSVR